MSHAKVPKIFWNNFLSSDLERRQNNFTAIRLLLAALVLYGHSYALAAKGFHEPLQRFLPKDAWIGSVAVRAFFFISGLLITRSYCTRNNLEEFIKARIYRIYPAHLVCLLFCVFFVGPAFTALPLVSYFSDPKIYKHLVENMFLWNIDFHLPGVFEKNRYPLAVNGSLWTLPSELRCYLFVAAFGLIGLFRRSAKASVGIISLVVLGFLNFSIMPLISDNAEAKVPCLFFAIGALCCLNATYLPVNALLFIASLIAGRLVHGENLRSFFFSLNLCYGTLIAAYRLPFFDLDRWGDFSYGLYIYAFPVQQMFASLFPKFTPTKNTFVSMPTTLLLAVLSWYFIEKRALALAQSRRRKQRAAALRRNELGATATGSPEVATPSGSGVSDEPPKHYEIYTALLSYAEFHFGKNASDESPRNGKRWWEAVAILVSSAVFCRWTLDHRNFFRLDDFQWEQLTYFNPMSSYAHFIPMMPYNDRPVGALFLKFLFAAFGVHSTAHHVVLLLVHTGAALLFLIVLRLFLREYPASDKGSEWSENIPWVAAMLFAGWSASTLLPISWDAAIFDLLACPLALLACLFYFKARRGPVHALYGIGAIALYYAALRTKEMTIALPAMLACFEFSHWLWRRRHQPGSARPRLVWLAVFLAIMCGYVARIMWIKSVNPNLDIASSPYYLSHSPVVLLRNVGRYLLLYFDPWQQENDFGSAATLRWPVLFLFASVSAASVWAFIRHRSPLILAPIFFLLQLAPVLPMQNMQSRLYLYLPSLFLSVITATALCWAARPAKLGRLPGLAPWLAGGAALALLITSYNGACRPIRAWFLAIGGENRLAYANLSKLPRPALGAKLYVINIPESMKGVSFFGMGSGNGSGVSVFFNDNRLTTQSVFDPAILAKITQEPSAYVIDYNRGLLKKASPITGEAAR